MVMVDIRQGILGYGARNLDLNVKSIENQIYLSFWESYEIKNTCGFTPMWIGWDIGYNKLNIPCMV